MKRYILTELLSVTIPTSTIIINDFQYAGCSISKITIPTSVQSIGLNGFSDSYRLVSVVILGQMKSIGAYAFSACIKLSSINIPTSVVSINTYTFYSTALSSITIPITMTNIGNHAFFYSTALTSVNIPTSVTNIGIIIVSLLSASHHYYFHFIGTYAFFACPLTCIIDWNPTTVRTIGTNALPTTTTCGILINIFITYISTYIKRKLL